jgi:hypothetical protein
LSLSGLQAINHGNNEIMSSFFMILSLKLIILQLGPNVRRYVALAQSRGGARFCTRGAMQGYDINLFILALAKTVTPGGRPRREPGQPVPPLTVFHFVQKILAAQKPMTYTDLLCAGFIYSILSSCSLGWHFVMLL